MPNDGGRGDAAAADAFGRRDAAAVPADGRRATPARAPARPIGERAPGGSNAGAAAPPRAQQPVALLYGPGHRIVHANAAFLAEFGDRDAAPRGFAGSARPVLPMGVPAAEALIDIPPIVLEVVDRVLSSGRPLATWVNVRGSRRRLTVAPRSDPETAEVYGVALRLARE
jgi:hypothetical protein